MKQSKGPIRPAEVTVAAVLGWASAAYIVVLAGIVALNGTASSTTLLFYALGVLIRCWLGWGLWHLSTTARTLTLVIAAASLLWIVGGLTEGSLLRNASESWTRIVPQIAWTLSALLAGGCVLTPRAGRAFRQQSALDQRRIQQHVDEAAQLGRSRKKR